MSISKSPVGAQDDPYTTTVILSVVCPHVLYSASSPLPLTKYSIVQSGILSSSSLCDDDYPSDETIQLKPFTKDMWGCFWLFVALTTNRAAIFISTQFDEVAL
jgi:hypothetical protein